MLTRQEQSEQKYGGANTAIDSWLAERQDLLVKYCQLAGLPPFESNKNSLPDHGAITNFCQIMIDYLSAGHFEIYDNIVNQCTEHGKNSAELAERVYPLITETTESLVDFNDKYANLPSDKELTTFDYDLSELGKTLEQRMEFEDELIHILYSKHS
ncbi:sigma D regulator [Psychrosphaera haliotis]|mgnify:FL=1|uniref:sigma D regulator n=1 Tax=Psychrosphaera haliotis TaxID=555083 RepID=UPI00236FB4FB|nr:sigma D regulator [Psychrosphaera haliotis]